MQLYQLGSKRAISLFDTGVGWISFLTTKWDQFLSDAYSQCHFLLSDSVPIKHKACPKHLLDNPLKNEEANQKLLIDLVYSDPVTYSRCFLIYPLVHVSEIYEAGELPQWCSIRVNCSK